MNYLLHYNLLISRAKSRSLQGYKEQHHIIPRCLGGTDVNENLVDLTPEEHYLAHLLLVKINPEEPKLVHAAVMMIPNRKSNKMYGWLRRKQSSLAKLNVGPKNNSYGTMWVNDGIKAFKIKKTIPLEPGWSIGRSLKKRLCETCGEETGSKWAMFCKDHRVYIKPERLEQITKPLAVIEKAGITKHVNRNQVPSYQRCGWIRVS